jgi:D-cysteine desulfhydrase
MPQHSIPVEFRDEWTCGGYEIYNDHLLDTVSIAARAGIFVDPTYSGKAFTGLVDMVKRREIPPGSKVLFWHTGGLLNLMACREFVGSDLSLRCGP